MLLRLLLLLLPVLWGGALAKDSGYRLVLQESVTVQESLCVFVPCKFSYSWSLGGYPYLYWFKKEGNKNHGLLVATNNPKEELQETIQGQFLLLRDPKSNDCSLTIRDVNKRDNGTYYLYIENSLHDHTYEDQMLSLEVTALTDKPGIQIPGPLESGQPKKLTCFVRWACEEGTPPTFSWTSAAYTSLGPRTHHLSSVLTLTPRPQDHGTNLTCQVHFPATGVSVESTIRLNVAYAPQNMVIRVFQGNSTVFKILQTTSLSILEGEALRLLCVADSNPPAKLSWFRGSPGLHATPISSTAILELPRVGPAQEGEFTCQARHPLGPHSVSLSLSLGYPPQLLGPSCSWEDQGLHCSCSSRAQPAPSLRWRLGAGLLEGNHGNASHVVTSGSEGPWTNSSLTLNVGLSVGLRLNCEARNVHGAQSASVLLLPERKGEGERDRNSNDERESLIGCLPHAPYREEMEPATWACALTRDGTRISWFTGGCSSPELSWALAEQNRQRVLGGGGRGETEARAWVSHPLSSAGKALPQAGAVPAALGGAGATALLSLCVCLIFFCM